jgi:6,7-dimethyl-8-ribityllumazine synthase
MLKPIPTRPRISTPSNATRIAVVASNYNAEFVEPMVTRALDEIRAIEPGAEIEVSRVPGSFEIPYLTSLVIARRKPDAVICLGVIFEGKTGHARLIARSVSEALCRISTETLIPVIHGVLLLGDQAQAQERCLGDASNRGTEAARAAIEVLRTARSLSQR